MRRWSISSDAYEQQLEFCWKIFSAYIVKIILSAEVVVNSFEKKSVDEGQLLVMGLLKLKI